MTWPATCQGDHCATNDQIAAWLMARDAPGSTVDDLFKRVIYGGTTRATGTLAISSLVPSQEYMVQAWFRHLEPDGSYTYSATAQDIVEAHA